MNKLKEKYIDNISNIVLTDERNAYLRLETINRYKKRKRNKKIIFSLIMMFSILIIGTGITYAEEIKEIVSSIFTKSYTEKVDGNEVQKIKLKYNGVKEINYNADLKEPTGSGIDSFKNEPIDKDSYSMYTYEELEKELGIKLLKNDLFKKDKFILKTLEKNDGKIATIGLYMINVFKYDNKENKNVSFVSFNILIKTKYAERKENSELNHGNYTDETIPKYKVGKLNTIAYGIEYGKRRRVYMDYDDVLYSFTLSPGADYHNKPDEEVQKILDGFHY
ncbi:hypothetical protein EGP95_06920 [bacterium]|nr:hypothetical protein [bacterium]